PPTPSYTLSLHDALPISVVVGDLRVARPQEQGEGRRLPGTGVQTHSHVPGGGSSRFQPLQEATGEAAAAGLGGHKQALDLGDVGDRKSTRLNSSHSQISY